MVQSARKTTPKGSPKKVRFGKRSVSSKSGLPRATIKRLAHAAGVLRVGEQVYDRVQDQLEKDFVQQVMRNASAYAEINGRSTIKAKDILAALKQKNITLYGFGDM